MNSERVQKLALINNEKFNKLINALSKDNKENQILNDATASKEKVNLLEGYDKMKKSVKRNASGSGEDIVQFLKKKKAYKETLSKKDDADVDDDKDEDEKNIEDRGIQLPKKDTKEYARYELGKFFRNQNITRGNLGNVRIRGRQFHFNYDDFINDLITDNRTRANNLNRDELELGLEQLDRLGMSTTLIRSKKIRELYKKIRKQRILENAEFNISQRSLASRSLLPLAASTPTTPTSSRATSTTPQTRRWRKFF